jgi:hypothetical protein
MISEHRFDWRTFSPARAGAAASPGSPCREDQVGLAGLQADLEDLLPQGAGVDLATTSPVLGERRPNMAPSRTASMNSSVIEMPWCRFSALRLKSPDGLRISRNSSISGWWMSR